MHLNEVPSNLLRTDFDSRSFLLSLRRENERIRELSTIEFNRQCQSNYSSIDHRRGFARLMMIESQKKEFSSYLISNDGQILIDELSKQLLNDDLSLVHQHWQRSKRTLTKQIVTLQSDFDLRTNTSVRKTMNECRKVVFHWISKYR